MKKKKKQNKKIKQKLMRCFMGASSASYEGLLYAISEVLEPAGTWR